MKKVLAILALTAMIAVASVANAQDTFTVGASVAPQTSTFSTTCASLALTFGSIDYATTQTDTCTMTITANSAFSLTAGDQDDDVALVTAGAASGGIPCTGTCDPLVHSIAGGSGTITAGTAGVGYYVTGTPTPDTCNGATAACEAIETNDALFTNELTALSAEVFTFTMEAAIDNVAPVQAAGAYGDGWQVTFS